MNSTTATTEEKVGIIKNIEPFFAETKYDQLFQGDVLCAKKLGLKDDGSKNSPDFWMIITKSCDLVINNDELDTTPITMVSVLPLNFLLRLLNKSYSDESKTAKKILVVALERISTFTTRRGSHSKSKIENDIAALIHDKFTQAMYLPPDGSALNEPMIIDFQMVFTMPIESKEQRKKFLEAKILQLSSPFREKVAQRFGKNYTDIGLNDDEIRSKSYKQSLITHLTKSNTNISE